MVDDSGCRTPDRAVGNCIPIKQCQPMVEVLRVTKRPISAVALKKLQAFTCGTDGSGYKVHHIIYYKEI